MLDTGGIFFLQVDCFYLFSSTLALCGFKGYCSLSLSMIQRAIPQTRNDGNVQIVLEVVVRWELGRL